MSARCKTVIVAVWIAGMTVVAGCSAGQDAAPTADQAVAAVRRYHVPIAPPLDHAVVTLGSCAADAGLARCAIELVWDPCRSSRSQHRVVAFARFADRWEVAIW